MIGQYPICNISDVRAQHHNKSRLNGGLFWSACLCTYAMFRTPKRARTISSESSDVTTTPPSTSSCDSSPIVNGNCSLDSPSPGYSNGALSPGVTEQHRRGRPRAEVLNSLRIQGYTSPSSIKCTYCNRVFPREKSLQAHLRTHTGERPYICDYPRCTRRFAQSGQLKTHQRLHTGEKPFVCGWSPGCPRRFTHANRHCPDHPDAQLRRCGGLASNSNTTTYPSPGTPGTDAEALTNGGDDDQHRKEIQRWMEGVKRRELKIIKAMNGSTGTSKKSLLQALDQFSNPLDNIENYDYSNIILSPNSLSSSSETPAITPKNHLFYNTSPTSKHSGQRDGNGTYMTQLFKEDDSLGISPSGTSELPKKRWLRKATLEQQQSIHQELASPINWAEEVQQQSPIASTVVEVENLKRPTVLMHANHTSVNTNGSSNVSNMDMQVVMALMDLKNNRSNINYRI